MQGLGSDPLPLPRRRSIRHHCPFPADLWYNRNVHYDSPCPCAGMYIRRIMTMQCRARDEGGPQNEVRANKFIIIRRHHPSAPMLSDESEWLSTVTTITDYVIVVGAIFPLFSLLSSTEISMWAGYIMYSQGPMYLTNCGIRMRCWRQRTAAPSPSLIVGKCD